MIEGSLGELVERSVLSLTLPRDGGASRDYTLGLKCAARIYVAACLRKA